MAEDDLEPLKPEITFDQLVEAIANAQARLESLEAAAKTLEAKLLLHRHDSSGESVVRLKEL